jgi:hypothetical protein
MKDLLSNLEGDIPDVRSVMMHALQNVKPTHLLDPELIEAWQKRPADVRPRKKIPRRQWSRHGALPVVASDGSGSGLPLLG